MNKEELLDILLQVADLLRVADPEIDVETAEKKILLLFRNYLQPKEWEHDNGCSDRNHLAACRTAALKCAEYIHQYNPQLSKDLIEKYPIMPRMLRYYKAIVNYKKTDDLVPGAAPNRSIVHVRCTGIQEDGEPYSGQLIFTPAESCLWIPLCDLELIEEITADQYKDALDNYLTLNEQADNN